ncbi:serine hydrolase-like protein [Austrofundulus limnaeus]|uniref:Serine hydrolase-like protein n=1 Tax=Austrofundulus limnaeus TaxID=52670 RepID=A0A2I4AY61_AUSLI|nr:PREDICTED: serine hydrolase-like protein 2 [Austrofundulus limnaeus]
MIQALKSVRHMTSGTIKQTVSELSIPLPWGEIRGKIWGPDHGRPVLCLHGWADNCGTFNTLIPLLPKDFRYVAMDLPGHGCSSHRPPGILYSFLSYVMDVRRVVDALRWSKFSIIGHSMGGNIAGTFSAVYPEMVDTVVLVDSFGFLPTDLKELPEILKQGMDGMLEMEKQSKEKPPKVYSYEKAVERLMAGNESLTEKSAKILLERGLVQVEGGVVFSRDMRLHLRNIVRFSLEQNLDFQSRIEASVLVVLAEGGFGKLLSEDDKKKFLSQIIQGYKDKNHTVVSVPGNHHVHLNNPEVVAPVVSNFLMSELLTQSTRSDVHTSKL